MKKLLFLAFALCLTVVSCTPESVKDENTQATDFEACPAPDTNCNGIPDHEE